ncbi:MAG: 50S ribosomal protein L35 [Candidatus Izemoplasmatales bacterium]|uniref:Large ribosomal subunit protein bL35 n=1 Tax=Hujiaoplasma nucleasis TaxID=2725268 RepID=A0A7L6N0C8_9MOLU|nr:50S ribosomal protein L35 [Hujiaoplasma nucleasis]QLY39706.1 50S ribosomal protein L35 [Hujiaoplasma nucleasis]
MPKMKSHSGTKKRLKRTGSGKLSRPSTYSVHLKSHRTPKQNRQARREEIISPSDLKRIKDMVPYL